MCKLKKYKIGDIVQYKDNNYTVTNEIPKNGDLVITDNYGVWIFMDETGHGSAPLPYWANKNACMKLTLKS